MAKLFTIVQTGWFILQCIARLAQGIGITTLELSTAAFVVCTIGTNIMWWAKPKDVFVPVVLRVEYTLHTLLQKTGLQILHAKAEATGWKWSPVEKYDDLRPNFLIDVGQYLPRINSSSFSQSAQKIRFRNDRLPPLKGDSLLCWFSAILFLIFGNVYIAGWNVSFSTDTERLIWRICIITMFSLVVACWVVGAAIELHEKKKKVRESQKVAITPMKMVLFTVISLVYIAIRAYILIEPFICLRSLPVVAFATVRWTAFIPHL